MARHGKGPKWLVPVIHTGDDDTEVSMYLREVQKDPTANGLAQLLATDSDELFNTHRDFWLVLEFYGPGAHLVLPLELATDDRAEEIVQTNIRGQSSTGSKENLQLANSWLHNCINNHTSCGHRQDTPWLPTRLLYVGSKDTVALRLISSSSINPENRYATLSYRWGKGMKFVLTSANLTKYQEDIPISTQYAILRDAVEVTRALGLQYLWVDSMCIMQDDPDDWARESVTMSKVYGLSTCTIAAANSGVQDSGCFATRNRYRVRPLRVPNPFKTDSKISFYVRSQYLHRIHTRYVRDSLWYNRGWVFQERTLSPRLLIFSKRQILWACQQVQAAETWPCGKTSENHIDRFESFEVEKARFHQLLDPSKGVASSNDTWWTFIKDYTGSNLTKMSDRLVALQGIATQIEGHTGQSYCSGFWINDTLSSALLWTTTNANIPRPKEYRGPSWSWGSIDGPIEFNSGRFSGTALVHILGTEPLPGSHHRNIKVPLAALILAGRLLPAIMRTSKNGRCEKLMSEEGRYEQSTDGGSAYGQSIYELPTYAPDMFEQPASEDGRAASSIEHLTRIQSGILKVVSAIVVFIQLVYSMLLPTIELVLSWCRKVLLRRRAEPDPKVLKMGLTISDLENREEQLSETLATSPDLGARCVCDVPLARSQVIDVVCLPVLQTEDHTCGLLLQLVDGTTENYQRIGIFEVFRDQLQKLPRDPGENRFLLV